GPPGAARPGRRPAPRRRRPSARRTRRQGAAPRGPSRRPAHRLRLLQPHHARERRQGARRRMGLPPRARASRGHVPAHAACRDSGPADPLVSTYDALASLPLRVDGDKLGRLLDRYPGTRLKLDPTSEWTEEFVDAVAASGAVDVVDLKGAYHGTPVDQPPDPALYERVARGFPEAWIEDPALTPETDRILEPFRDRIRWDAPIPHVPY